MKSPIPPLSGGDAVAILAPSGLSDSSQADRAARTAGALNLVPIIFPSCRKKPSYFSFEDPSFADELNHAFFDASIRSIWVIGDASGAFRLMRLLRFRTAGMHPKFFCAPLSAAPLHCAFNKLSGMTTLLAPNLGTTDWNDMNLLTQTELKDALFAEQWNARVDDSSAQLSTMAKGVCEGQLFAATLETLCASLGTPYAADAKDCILLLDSCETSLKAIDRMFVQLKHAGVFEQCAGLFFGSFAGCAPDVADIVADRVLDEGKPVLCGAPLGVSGQGRILPLGRIARMDATKKQLDIL